MSQQRTAVGPSSQPRRTTPTAVAGPVGRKAPNTAAKKPAAGGPAKGRGAVNTKGKVIVDSFLTALIRTVLTTTTLQFALCFFLLFYLSSPSFSFHYFVSLCHTLSPPLFLPYLHSHFISPFSLFSLLPFPPIYCLPPRWKGLCSLQNRKWLSYFQKASMD